MNNKLFVGDSNVYIFNYLKNYGANIIKFKGGPLKGIVNKNDNYNVLINTIDKKKISDIYLIFGVVDLNFYYYFKKYKENKPNVIDDIITYSKKYVKIVSELNVKNKTIIGILPSPIKDKYFRIALVRYGILSIDIANIIPEDDILMINRNKRIEMINNILEEECKKYNIKFCNIFHLITKNYKLVKLFSIGKYNRINIHHRYEYLFLIFINSCLKYLIQNKNYINIVNDLENSYNKYIKDKIYNRDEYTKEKQDKLYKKSMFIKNKILKYIDKILIK